MWLINTNNLELKQVISEQDHRYAIVSHRWAKNLDDEVSFQDFQSIERSRDKKWFLKICGAQEQAQKDEIPYFWMDTCCTIQSHHR
jgi:DNA polymerase III alpha subunit (gram-positive type)